MVGQNGKIGQISLCPLIFPLPYTDKPKFIPHCHAVLEPWHISHTNILVVIRAGANKLSTDPNSKNISVTLWRVC